MGRIVAIAGGDLKSTEGLNQYMVELSKKEHPNVLFIGTASEDAESYIEKIEQAFSELGCMVKSLALLKETYINAEIDKLLAWAEVIYVGGGDTVSMMKVWKKYSVDQKLKEIYRKDTAVLCGISAGAICWFSCGHSDSEAFLGKGNWQFIFAEGMLDIHHMAFCPHYNEEGRESFDEMLKGKNMLGLAMENETAFVEIDGEISFIRSRENAKAYTLSYKDGEINKEKVVFIQNPESKQIDIL